MKVTIKNSSITGTKCIEDLGDVLLVEARDGRKWKSLTSVFENNTTDLKVKVAASTEGESGFKTVSKETTETIEVAANTTT